MDQRSIGSLRVSVIGLGCNQFGRKIDRAATASVVGAAIDAGINFLDTADRYGYGDQPFSGHGRSEEFVGAAIRSYRDEVVLATKFGNPMGDDPRNRGAGERWIRLAVEDSLRRLKTDRIDLYQLHTPDPDTPIAETLGVLNDLIAQGKVREIGCSKFSPEELREAEAAGASFPKGMASVQNEYSLLAREPEQGVLDVCKKAGIAFVPYFPLAGGLLTGKYRKGGEVPTNSRLALFPPGRAHLGLSDDNLEMVERYTKFAEARGHTVLQLAFAWLYAHQEVASVIAGSTSPEQARQNAGAGDWHLAAEDLAELESLRQ